MSALLPSRRICLASFLVLAAARPLPADVKLPSLISDHAVLQKSTSTHVWGKADPGENVKVTLGPASAQAVTDAQGRWQASLDLGQSGPGPFDLVVQGKNQLTIHDVVVGEVWVGSGQSNMESPIARTDETADEIAHSADAGIRHFKVSNTAEKAPADDVRGSWVVAGPTTTAGFGAVGYYFAKNLRQALGVPVGIINASWGGTPIEPWMSREAIDSVPDLKKSADQSIAQADGFPAVLASYASAFQAWATANARADRPADPTPFADPAAATADWQTVTLPGKISGPGLPQSGALWLRRNVDVPASALGKVFQVDVGAPSGFVTCFWDGHKLGGTAPDAFPGVGAHVRYSVPLAEVQPGPNTIALRIYDPAGPFAEAAPPILAIYPSDPLPGPWFAKGEYELPPITAEVRQSYPRMPRVVAPANDLAAYLFNGMIHPLLPCTMAGVLWYQGEANAGRAYQYRSTFPLLIQDWRKQWGWEFPFYFCQIAVQLEKAHVPAESTWAELREAQTMALALPKTGQAVTLDLGEEGEVHYRDKRDVGARLALIALAKTYGKSVVYSGPVYDSCKIEGNKVRLTFTSIGGGLVAKPVPATYRPMSIKPDEKPLVRNSPNSQLEGFCICGEDHQWAWADARIDGDTVVVSSPSVPAPVAVRYAWADDPICNLYNQAGLPAGSFRTDTFPVSTEKASH